VLKDRSICFSELKDVPYIILRVNVALHKIHVGQLSMSRVNKVVLRGVLLVDDDVLPIVVENIRIGFYHDEVKFIS